jgi:hypothetical protein
MSHDVYIVYGDAETYEEDYSFLSGVSFGLQDGALVMTVSFRIRSARGARSQ